jgi:lipoprotein-anchoring transpeptidase ErfK/SrfK
MPAQFELAQLPPPPFYIDPHALLRPWFQNQHSTGTRKPRMKRSPQQSERNAEQDVVRQRLDAPQASPAREPNYALTRHLRGNYKQRIATVLRHSPKSPPAKGPLLLTVSISKQTITVYDAGVQVAKAPVSTGMPGHSTPMGVFSVLDKEWWHRSNLYSGAPMPFMQRLTWSGIALHAGELPGYRASHGCIRLPESFALRLWHLSKVGARVVIAWNELSPAEISHPLLFQPQPAPQPLAPLPPATTAPSEDAPVSMNQAPTEQDMADAERDHMMLAAADDGESVADVGDSRPALQFALALTGIDGEAIVSQPVLEFLSARRKTSGRQYARGPEAEYEAVSRVDAAASLSIFISRRDGRLYVRKDAQPLFDVPVTIAEPGQTMGTHVFTAVANDGASRLRWSVVSPTNEAAEERNDRPNPASLERVVSKNPAAALDRIAIPQDAAERIAALVSVGASVIVSDAGLGRTAAVPNADFSVVLH